MTDDLENSLSSKLFTFLEMPYPCQKKFFDCSYQCVTEPGLADSYEIYSLHFWENLYCLRVCCNIRLANKGKR